ncbi:MAG: hypothetical protein WBJ28_03400, partial [Bacilli bacterium]
MSKLIFDPLEEYRDKFKGLHDQNVNRFFDELVQKSGINIPENDLTVKEIDNLNIKIDNEEKVLRRARRIRGFLLFLFIAALIVFILFIVAAVQGEESSLTMSVGARVGIAIGVIVFGIAMLIIVIKVLRPRIKDSQARLSDLISKRDEKIRLAWAQVNPLNELFDANMTPMLVEKTIPLLTMDPFFDSKRLDYLVRKYELSDFTPDNESAEFVQSGEIQGNPFILARTLVMNMGTKTYTGTLTVSYTVTVYVNGKAQRQTRTETLRASVNKPCPY